MPRTTKVHKLRFALMLLAAAVSSVLWNCVPLPITPGYVSTAPRKRGDVDMTVQAGGVFPGIGGGGGRVERYLTKRLSLPIELMGAYNLGFVSMSGRLGLRYRVTPYFSIGGGAGGGFSMEDSDEFVATAHLDLELAFGHRWRWFGLSFTLRPTVDPVYRFFFLPMDLAVAFYWNRTGAVTLHALGGPVVNMGPPDTAVGMYAGGALGVLLHF